MSVVCCRMISYDAFSSVKLCCGECIAESGVKFFSLPVDNILESYEALRHNRLVSLARVDLAVCSQNCDCVSFALNGEVGKSVYVLAVDVGNDCEGCQPVWYENKSRRSSG